MWQANLTANQTLQTADYNYLISDHLGTPQLAVNSQGQPTWKIHSDAFGNTVLDPNNQITLNLRFPGQYYDQETGLSYNYFRDYNSKIGRYIQSDPIGLNGGVNTFRYVEGNPIRFYDQQGLESCGNDFCKASFMDCLSRCITTYDLLSEENLDDYSLVAKGGLALSGGMVGKKWVGLRTGFSGATSATSLPSLWSFHVYCRDTLCLCLY